MSVAVYVDPQLRPDLPLTKPTAAEFEKHVSDADTIRLLIERAKPRVRRSPETKQILNLTFGSRDRGRYFDWVLDQSLDRLVRGGEVAVKMLGRPDQDATALLRQLMLHLGGLHDWREVNRRRFSAYRLMVNSEVAEALSLPGEHVSEDGGSLVAIFEERIG